MPARLSIVMPTLNAASVLPATADALLEGVSSGLVRELVITDGGSTDETRAVAQELGAHWVEGPPGRGGQLRRGVEAATGDWLLLLHADTHPEPDWAKAVYDHMTTRPEKAAACAVYLGDAAIWVSISIVSSPLFVVLVLCPNWLRGGPKLISPNCKGVSQSETRNRTTLYV